MTQPRQRPRRARANGPSDGTRLRVQTTALLEFLAGPSGAGPTGAFLPELALTLARILASSVVLIAELAETHTARTVAFVRDGGLQPPVTYRLPGTPCEQVAGKKLCTFARGIQEAFPQDAMLRELGLESYVGLPLWNSRGQPIGLIAVLDRRPLADRHPAETLLQIAAFRAAAELERLATERLLRQSEASLAATLRSMDDLVFVLDDAGRFVEFLGAPGRAPLLVPPAEFVGRSFREVLPPPTAELVAGALERLHATGHPQEIEYTLPLRDTVRWWHAKLTLREEAPGVHTGVVVVARDVTGHKEAEVARAESESRYRRLLSAVTDYHFTVQIADGRAVHTVHSPECTAVTGYSPDDYASNPFLWLEMVHPEDRARVRDSAERATAGVAVPPLEHRIFHRDGRIRWMRNTLTPRRDDAGRTVACDGVVTDITEERIARDALVESERRYRELVDLCPDSVLVHQHGRIVFANPAARQLAGAAFAEDLVGLPVLERVHPDDRADVAERVGYILATGSRVPPREERLLRLDGSVVFAEVASTAIALHGGPAVLVVARDITERRRIEESLRASEERWQFALEGAGDGVWDWDIPSGRVFYSRRAKEMLGYADGEFAPELSSWESRIHPDDRAAVAAAVQRLLAGADEIYSNEHRIRCRDGSYIWVLDRGKVVQHDGGGRPLRAIGTHSDVTARKQLEVALQAREALYRGVVESSADGFWLSDREGRIRETNQAYLDRSGYTRAELLAMKVSDLEARENAEETRAHIAKVFAHGNDLFETLHRTKDGTVWQVEINATFLGEPSNLIASFIRDIHRRKRSESLLRTRLRLTEIAASGSTDELLQYTLDQAELHTGSSIGFFHFVAADQENLSLQTWSTNTLRHMCTAEGKGRHYPVSQAGIWVECIRARAPVVHNDYASHPGKRGLPPGHASVVRELTVPILRDNRVVAIMGVGNKRSEYVAEDIETLSNLASFAMDFVAHRRAEEERRHAEELRRESEARLRLALDGAQLGIWSRAFGADTFRLDDRARRHFGTSAETLPVADALAAVHPEDRPRLEPFLAGRPGDGAEAERAAVEFRLAGRNGAARILRMHFRQFTEEGPATPAGVQIIATSQDITEEKRLEENYLRAQRMEVVGRLAAGVAHDLNNILLPVMMAPRLLRPVVRDAEALDLLDTVESCVRRGADVIKQLLTFGRGTTLQRRPVGLQDLVRDVVHILRETLPRNVAIRTELPAPPCFAAADSTQLHQVLMNLAVNARDAMPAGGTLLLQLATTDVSGPLPQTVPESTPGRYHVLTVADTGKGIPPENLEKLFDPFFTTKEVGEGTGLGLATVLGIVRSHRGFVQVESRPGAGATFRVFLPALDTAAAVAATPAAPAAPDPAVRRSILLVDDEPRVRLLMQRTLERHGFRVTSAGSGEEALALLRRGDTAFDLVITDILMPSMDGSALIEILRREFPPLKIVAVSGHLSLPEMRARWGTLVDGSLQKPFSADELVGLLAALLAPPAGAP